MAIITFVTAGDTTPTASKDDEPTLTPQGREQSVGLRKKFYEPPEDAKKRKNWEPERFDLALVEPSLASRTTALIVLRKQVPAVPMLYLPALCPDEHGEQTKTDIAELYRQLGNAPLSAWAEINTRKIQGLGAYIKRAKCAISIALDETGARRIIVISQHPALMAGIALNWTNDDASYPLLLDTVFAGGEGFRLDADTGAVALIKR